MSSRYSGGVVRKNQLVPTTSLASGVWNLGEATQATKSDTWPYSGIAVPLQNSLRFRASATAYLNRTGSTATNAKLATYSFWFKRGALTTGQWLFTGGTTVSLIGFNGSSDLLSVLGSDTSGEGNITTAVFRDPSAWYHVVIAIDTSQATTADRAKIYVNGVLQAVTVSNGGITLNSNWGFNTAGTLNIGRYGPVPGSYTDGYMAEVNFIDGQALDPSYFGQTSAITGVWEPKQYTSTYGTNGFHLEFKDATVGQDTSGNNNDWTPNNISTTLDSTYDLMTDVPTQWSPRGTTDVGGVVRGNYAVLNPLNSTGGTLSGGNLNYSMGNTKVAATMMGMTSGKYYSEITVNSTSNGLFIIGLCKVNTALSLFSLGVGYYADDGTKYVEGTNSSYGASYTAGNVIGIAADFDSNQVTFYKNNASQGAVNLPSSTDGYVLLLQAASGSTSATFSANFGQRPFTYTPPTGFKSLCTTNLPTPTIGATVATAANKYFDATLYTGTGAALSVTNAGSFQPDFVWLKSRSATTNNQLFDAVRGATKVIVSNTTESESTSANTITSFNSGGFTVGTNTAINTSAATYVAWQWKAGGANTTNTSGTITSTVNVNQTAGFSVVTYTGNGTAGATVGHGLGVAPSVIFAKVRSRSGDNWHSYHSALGGTQGILLNATNAASTDSGFWNNTNPNSSVFTVGTYNTFSSQTYVAYCWSEIAGFSKFGSYTGNGSTDGPFVYTGFRPRFLMIKRTDGANHWLMYDTSRDTYNVGDKWLRANAADVEATGLYWDGLSNGFKIRVNDPASNASGGTYIYMAFAETPFKNSLAR